MRANRRRFLGSAVSLALLVLSPLACDTPEPAESSGASGAASTTSAYGHLVRAETNAEAHVTAAAIAGPLRFLSDDLLEGRAPGTRGSELTQRYIATEMQTMGLAPGGDDGGWLQKVPLVGVTAHVPPRITFTGPASRHLTLSVPDDLVVVAGEQARHSMLDASDVVFVGYGIVAPEYHWDDYKDVDVHGKVVLVMNDDPSSDPALFGGKTRLWYGRWDYKYLEAAKHGAAGAIVIHTAPSASYPWQVVVTSNEREKFDLPPADEPRLVAKMWATEDVSRKMAALGGKDLDALRKDAESAAFHAVPLGLKVAFPIEAEVRWVESANVLGVLPGSDPAVAKEVVVFTAHHDHLGIGLPRDGDAIYNGAVDNASGVAALLTVARAASAARRPRRTMLFMAVTAEEQGLLGSEWYCQHPTFPAKDIAADINMDVMNMFGQTSTLGYTGLGKSSLDDVVKGVAAAQKRTVTGDPFPEKGSFYRSDQFSFAKIGVPSIVVRGGPEYVGRPPGWGQERVNEYETLRYHQPSDQYDPSWDLSGAVEDVQLLLVSGLRVANGPALPTWTAGDEFEAARKAALAK
jgi:Zn-dependent M28 family amino/carboxypeptidase